MTNKDPRHEARRVALAILFERAFHSIDQDKSINRVLEVYNEEDIDRDLLNLIVTGVAKNVEVLDEIVAKTAPAWPPDQITKADLITLRIAIFELTIAKNVPPKVAIDEAIELAKEFGGASSASFVNGVLGTVVKEYLETEEIKENESTEQKIKRMLSGLLGTDKKELRREASFTDDLNTDPTDLEDAFQAILREFGIDDKKRTFETVGQLIDFVKDYLNELEE